MAVTRKPLAHFVTSNSKGPVITPYFTVVDVNEMRKHPDYQECDAEGKLIESPPAPVENPKPRFEQPAPAPKKSKKAATV